MLLGTIIVGGFSLYIYQTTYNNISDKLVEEKQSYLSQAEGNLEQRIRTIEYSFSAYSTTSGFQKIIDKPLNYNNYRDVKKVSTELSYISTLSTENTDYSLISLVQNWKISSGALYTLSAKEKKSLLKNADESSAQLFWRIHGDGIQMIVSLPFFESTRSALGTATIRNNTIDNMIDSKNMAHLGIVSATGQPLFQNKKFINAKIIKNISQAENGLTSNSGSYRSQNGSIYVFSRSHYNNWLYISEVTHDQVVSQISVLAGGLIVIGLIILLLLYFVAFSIAKHSTKPINDIRDRLELDEVPSENSHQTSKGEISEILGGIDRIVTKNTILEQTIEHQKPELENLFVLNLYRNYVPSDEIDKRLTQFGYPSLTNMNFYTILVQIDDYGNHTFNANDILLMAVENIAGTIIPRDSRLKTVLVNKETQATTLFLQKNDDDTNKKLLDYCNSIQKAAKQYLKIKVSLGVSNSYQSLSDCKLAVDNAMEALRFRINLGEESIIFYDEIAQKLDQTAIIKYPENKQAMMDAIRAGDKENIKYLFPQVIQRIFEENTNPLSIKTSIVNLVSDIIQLGQLLGLNFELSHDIRHIYYDVITIDNQSKLISVLYNSLIVPIVNSSSDRTTSDLQSLSKRMIQIVHSRFDEDLALDSIAEELHYNANYLSTVFKKEFGTNFSDYLQNYRIEMSKKWLLETDMTVKEISNRLCYNNPQNFIRFFKKKEKITPGAYRHHYKSI